RDWMALPYDLRDYRTHLEDGVRGLRIAYSANLGYAKVDPEVAEIVLSAVKIFEALGAKIEHKDPGFENAEPVFRAHWFSGAAAGRAAHRRSALCRRARPARRARLRERAADRAARARRYGTAVSSIVQLETTLSSSSMAPRALYRPSVSFLSDSKPRYRPVG